MRWLKERPSRLAVPAFVAIVLWVLIAGPHLRWIFLAVLTVATVTAFLTNGRYALRRLLSVLPIMLVVSFVVFALMDSLPGDPAISILGPSATPDAVAQVHAELGLDRPFFTRYGAWLGDVVMGDLGTSVLRREPVAVGIGKAFTPTLQLMLYSMILATLISLPLGLYAAYKNGLRQDRLINTAMLGFFAVPNFVLAVMLVLFFTVGGISVFGTHIGFKVLKSGGYVPFGEDPVDHIKHMILPTVSLAMGSAAVFMRLLRSDLIGTLRLPFIDLARSKGLSTNRILWRHALRPSTFTLLTVMGFTVGTLMGGALITEYIFTLPGIGGYMFGAIGQRDFISVQGGTLVISTLYILVLVLVDFLYLALDPRLRTTGGGLGGDNG